MHFTVVIPLYNKEKHIKRAITSVLQQSYQNFEIIVVDDGSSDDGVKIVKQIKSTKIKVIKQGNKGVSSARNKGINNATYNYIGLLDADDSWNSDFLSVVKEMIEEYPYAGAYGTAHDYVTTMGEAASGQSIEGLKKGSAGTINYFKESLYKPILSCSSVVIPKSVFYELGGFPEGITRGEDQYMWTRIALNYKVVMKNKVCATYYLNTDNRSVDKKLESSKSIIGYAEGMLIKEKEKGNNSIYFEEYMINQIIRKARYLSENGQFKQARKLLKKYKHTQKNKKKWLKTYLLSFSILAVLNEAKNKLRV